MSEQPKFHVSLQVNDINRSVEFYGRLLGLAPSKHFSDYAKFETDNPGLVLSLERRKEGTSEALSHLGIRLDSKNELITWSSKVAERGLDFQHLENVACCYADQSKIYLNDPDGILFEIYNVNRDLDPETKAAPTVVQDQSGSAIKSYDHVLPAAFPQHLPFPDNALATIALRGTLNAALPDHVCHEILRECYRVLTPGGEVTLHMLVSDTEPEGEIPVMPEPASYVRRVPSEQAVWSLVREAGFTGLRADRFGAHHVFECRGSRFRELLLKAGKPAPVGSAKNSTWTVTYLGPFPRIELENGTVFTSGKRQKIDAEALAIISGPTLKASFVILNDEGDACGR